MSPLTLAAIKRHLQHRGAPDVRPRQDYFGDVERVWASASRASPELILRTNVGHPDQRPERHFAAPHTVRWMRQSLVRC
jgi:hypothetical protein